MAKRKHRIVAQSPAIPTPEDPPELPIIKFGEFKLTTNSGTTRAPTPPGQNSEEVDGGGVWERAGKRQKKSKPDKRKNVPEITLSPQRLRTPVNVADLQNLVLWLVADGVAPQWLLVKNKPEIRRAVVLMVPGLTMDMFDSTLSLLPPSYPTLEDEDMGVPISRSPDDGIEGPKEPELVSPEARKPSSPDNFWPLELNPQKLPPCLQEFPNMFKHAWPIKAVGDDRHAKLISPVSSFLNSPIQKGRSQPAAKNQGSKRISVSSLLMTVDELIEDEYTLHSSQLEQLGGEGGGKAREEAEKRKSEGWVETDLTKGNGLDRNEGGAVTEGKTIYAIDCEMCKTIQGLELTRISILNWDGEVVYDTLVKPADPITDYLTQYSGMTAALLEPVTTTLTDVQSHLLTVINADTILLGQSLNSDLAAMRFSHPHTIDTSVIYHHARGPPYKPSLKWLAQKFLRREIQTGGPTGHNSIEDARACLDLLKLKLDKGAAFGTADATTESIFKRLAHYPVVPRKGAVVDYGHPDKWYGAHATQTVAATTDSEVVEGVLSCAQVMDFTWGRLRALETLRGWHKVSENLPLPASPDTAALATGVAEVAALIKKVHDGLPKCTALIVYSGTGDPKTMKMYMDIQKEFRAQYQTKKWDEMSVRWTDVEDQGLKAAVKAARSGIGFLTVT